jgi:flagellar protein FliJ
MPFVEHAGGLLRNLPDMNAKEEALECSRFEIDQAARKVADLERTIRDIEALAFDLGRQITNEEARTGIKDLDHLAYSSFAGSARARDKLYASTEGLNAQLEAAREERGSGAVEPH